MAADKRGSHLALTLARLDELVRREGGRKPQRIGLSATVRPLAQVASFLSPAATVVDVGHRRAMDLHVEVPSDELGPVASNEMWGEIYDRVAEHVRAHRTTLIFVSTRRMSERVAFQLAARLGEGIVLPHHGSLSRDKRFEAEDRLKQGELRAVVATASLELGIDIGSIDLVVQLGTPRSIAVALQRIGRSGHWVGAKPEGRLFATTRDELLECAALVRGIRGGAMDALVIPTAPLDILAQQLVAFCSADEEWQVDALYAAVRSAYPYRDLARKDFDDVLTMLAEGVATSRGRSGAFLHHDRVNGRLRARRGARMAAITSGGAIPETANYNVVVEPDGQVVGTVDEDFAVESMAGDIFLLGSTSWQIRRVESGVVRVENANGAPPSIPFWNGESPGRTIELSREVCALRAGDRRARRCVRHRLADRRVRARPRRRRAGGGVRAGRQSGAGHGADRDDGRGRALLRRGRRDAADPAHPVRRAHQPRVGPGAAQEVLPLVQPRAAGRRDRQRHLPLADRPARFSARDRVRVRQVRRASSTPSPRPCSTRRCSARAGAGTPPGRWPSCACGPARRSRRSCSACAPTTCWPRSFPTRPPAPRT